MGSDDIYRAFQYAGMLRLIERVLMAGLGGCLAALGAWLLWRLASKSDPSREAPAVDLELSGRGRFGEYRLKFTRLAPSCLVILAGFGVILYAVVTPMKLTIEETGDDSPDKITKKMILTYADAQLATRLLPPLNRDLYDELKVLTQSLCEEAPQSDNAKRARKLLADVYEQGRLTEEQRIRRDKFREAERHLADAERLELQILNRRYGPDMKPE